MPFLKDKSKINVNRSRILENRAKKNGLRHAIFNVVGDKYIGEWKDNEKSGKGRILTRFNQLYEGDMDRNYRDGFGVLAYQLENQVYVLEYRGEWKNGKMDGWGMRAYNDGSFYIGEFSKGKRHGHGQVWEADGSFYDGMWFKDKRHGYGIMVLKCGNRYEGMWVDGQKAGKGRLYHLDSGQLQDGVWKNNVCVFSTIVDIPYRQTSLLPTEYPISQCELVDLGSLVQAMETKALDDIPSSCFSLAIERRETISGGTSTKSSRTTRTSHV